MGCVKPFKYPPSPPVRILVPVIMINTTTAQASSVDRSLVAGNAPTRLDRLHSTDMLKIAGLVAAAHHDKFRSRADPFDDLHHFNAGTAGHPYICNDQVWHKLFRQADGVVAGVNDSGAFCTKGTPID